MTALSLLALLVLAQTADPTYRFPENYTGSNPEECVCNEDADTQELNREDSLGNKVSLEDRLDLNANGLCDLLVDIHSSGSSGRWLAVYIATPDGPHRPAGAVFGWHFAPAAAKNGYARLRVTTSGWINGGKMLLPAVYVYDGREYVEEAYPCVSHGQYMDWGKAAYEAGDFEAAELHYHNAFWMQDGDLADANNLALVQIRQHRYDDAITLLERHFSEYAGGTMGAPSKASAHYNLGLAYEARGKMSAACEHYGLAAKLGPTEDRLATVERLKRQCSGEAEPRENASATGEP